jgi:hypothetical protein
MKKSIAILTSAVLLATPFAASAANTAIVYSGLYSTSGNEATFENIAEYNVKKLVIPATIGDLPVTQFNLNGIEDAAELAQISAANSSITFRSTGVALSRYVVHNNGKKGRDYKEWTDYALVAYPNAGPKTFTLTKDIVIVGDPGATTSVDYTVVNGKTRTTYSVETDIPSPQAFGGSDTLTDLSNYQLEVATYTDSNPFKYAPDGMTVYVPVDHPTFVVYKGSLYTYYLSDEDIVQNADGSYSGVSTRKPGVRDYSGNAYSAASGAGCVINSDMDGDGDADITFKSVAASSTGNNSTTTTEANVDPVETPDDSAPAPAPSSTYKFTAKDNKGVSYSSPNQVKGAELKKAQASGATKIYADSLVNNKISARLYLDLTALKAGAIKANLWKSLNYAVSVNNKSAKTAIQQKFQKYYGQTPIQIHFNQQAPFQASVRTAVKVDLTGLNTNSLIFYSYNASTNRYSKINTSYTIDTSGFLHFWTTNGYDVLITDKALKLV